MESYNHGQKSLGHWVIVKKGSAQLTFGCLSADRLLTVSKKSFQNVSEMPVVFYHSVIDDLGLSIC